MGLVMVVMVVSSGGGRTHALRVGYRRTGVGVRLYILSPKARHWEGNMCRILGEWVNMHHGQRKRHVNEACCAR